MERFNGPAPKTASDLGFYERMDHNSVQEWCEIVTPAAESPAAQALLTRIGECVLRGDQETAALISDLRLAATEASRSWYTGEAGTLRNTVSEEHCRRQFKALLALQVAVRQ